MKCLSYRRVALALAALAVQAASADYMYFKIGDDSTSYDLATVSKGSTPSEPLGLLAGGDMTPLGYALDSSSTEPAYADLGSLGTGYSMTDSIIFNLWTLEGSTPVKSYSYLLSENAGSIVSGASQSGTPLVVGSETVPEPTGGMLMLLGMVVLAMRRKTMMV